MKYFIIFLSRGIEKDQKEDINRLKGVIPAQHDNGCACITHVDQKLILTFLGLYIIFCIKIKTSLCLFRIKPVEQIKYLLSCAAILHLTFLLVFVRLKNSMRDSS